MCTVTLGIWAVTHSSGEESLGYMLLWGCTSCAIILYFRLNGVHLLVYLVNMSHLICERGRLSWASSMWASCEETMWSEESCRFAPLLERSWILFYFLHVYPHRGNKPIKTKTEASVRLFINLQPKSYQIKSTSAAADSPPTSNVAGLITAALE